MHISNRIQLVQSPIIQELQRFSDENTISLAQGIPFFSPPEKALDALNAAMRKSEMHYYSQDAGLPQLRDAIVEKLCRENGIMALSEEVMITAGANQGFVNALLAIADPGDEVILLRPYYFNHEMALGMLNIKPVYVDVDEDYLPVVETVESAITRKTRAIVTVSPNNPTGAVFPERKLKEINRLCEEYGIYHISDETYEYFVFGGESHFSPASVGKGHTITLFSFSKAFGMSGWRIGYMHYPMELHHSLLKVQDTIVICPSVPSQLLAQECLKIGRNYVRRFMSVMNESRRVMLRWIQEANDVIRMPITTGGYYLYLNIHTPLTGMEMARRLIKEYGVAVVPGEAFGNTEKIFLRISYGNVTPREAEEGMRRLMKGIEEMGEINNP